MGHRRTHVAAWVEGSVAGALLAWLTGCAMVPPNSLLDPTKVGRFNVATHEVGIRRVLTPRETPPGLAGAVEPSPSDLVATFDEYRITTGDGLAITIYDLFGGGVPPFSASLQVNELGEIRIPELGPIRVTGLTEAEFEKEVKRRLVEAQLLTNPIVMAFVQVRRGRVFTILGNVTAAGTYPIPYPDTRLLDVMGMVGDVAPNAREMYVIRRAGYTPPTDVPAAEPTPPAAVPAEELVIPPWAQEEQPSSSYVSEGTRGRARHAQEEPPPSEKEELAEVFTPLVRQEPAATQEAQEPEKVPFEPLIFEFDPETGRMQEAERPVARREVEGQPAELLEEDLTEPFDWEDVADYEYEQRIIAVNLRELKNGNPRYNLVVRDRDVINVPIDTGVFYMMGEVNRPGVYAFGGREITIKQAIATVGGFSVLAWPQRCELIRREPGTDKQLTMMVNLDAIFAGLEDDFYLRDEDIVNVGTHIVAPFLFVIRNSFRFTYGFGFVWDRNFADKYAYGARINPETLEQQRRQSRGLPF